MIIKAQLFTRFTVESAWLPCIVNTHQREALRPIVVTARKKPDTHFLLPEPGHSAMSQRPAGRLAIKQSELVGFLHVAVIARCDKMFNPRYALSYFTTVCTQYLALDTPERDVEVLLKPLHPPF